jgi:putative inorganic carbon (hco3(-)) transporter
VCAVASAIAVALWKRPAARLTAAAIGALCLLGCLFTLERSVWLGATVATVLALVCVRELRRYTVPALGAGVAAVIAALVLVPGLSDSVTERSNDQGTVWGRQSSNAAAINMIEARPLAGFGLDQFQEASAHYYEINDHYPLPVALATVHNLFLNYGAELGLPGVFLWTLGLFLALWAALRLRAPPDLRPWQIGLIAIAAFYVIVANFVPPAVYPNLIIWVWAGVVWAAHPSIPRPANERPPT